MASTTNQTLRWSDEELKAKVGQLFIVGFHGHVPSENIKSLIITHKVGTVILFQRNVDSATQLLELTNSLQELARSAGYTQDLFIAIDQENGLVTRIKPPVAAQLPGSMALGATKDASNAYKIAVATAETLKAFGINMNYAPIADVNSEPKNPVIGVRSPSDDPETVGRFVSAQFKGLQDGGILPCIKHFPGHGDTAVDSHYGLPVISKSKAEIEECELVPFKRAVAEGVDAVMTAHIVMPAIGDPEKKLPASLNPDAISTLRNEMGYEGLIISDCLEMDGVRAPYGTEKAAVMALKAGTDSVMICHTMSSQVGAIEMVIQAVKSGEISQESIQTSSERIEKLKTKYLPSARAPISASSPSSIESRNRRHATLASEVYAKSTTVVRSQAGTFPLSSNPTTKLVFISPGKTRLGGGAVESGEEKTREPHTPSIYVDLIRSYNPTVVDIRFHDGFKLSEQSEKAIDEAEAVILATRNTSLSPHQKEIGLSLGKKLGKKLIVIATCDPYDFLEEKEEVKNYITIYEPTVAAFKSAVDVIFGAVEPSGLLPVKIRHFKHEVRAINGSEDIDRIWNMWNEIFPKWPIEETRFSKMLTTKRGRHFIHENGFCLAYFVDAGVAKIAAIGVLPTFRGQGIGTTLVKTTHKQFKSEGPLTSFGIGSVFPRIWPGVPIDLPPPDKDFFLHRGFRKGTSPTARDLFKDITVNIAPQDVLDRVAKLPLKFAPWSPELVEECLTKQRSNFKNTGWVLAYERLAAANQHHEVMVAFDEHGTQVGWTLMCSLPSVVAHTFAFMPLMPSKEKTGLIACVGVDRCARGKGVGLALLVKAMEDMKVRGIEGVMIDWVVIRGFYERLGFEPFWEYEDYNW